MNNHQRIADAIRAKALEQREQARAACKECLGEGFRCNDDPTKVVIDGLDCTCDDYYEALAFMNHHVTQCESVEPCPTCTPEYNRLTKLADKWCWHELYDIEKDKWGGICSAKCQCGYPIYTRWDVGQHRTLEQPVPTIPTIKAALVALGLWDAFVKWLWEVNRVRSEWDGSSNFIFKSFIKVMEIISDEVKFLQAVISFMEGR